MLLEGIDLGKGKRRRRYSLPAASSAAVPLARLGRIWTYVGDAPHPFTVYDYTPTRRQEGPLACLKSFRDRLQADAYSGYDPLYDDPERAIIEIACWAHARHKFYEAQSPTRCAPRRRSSYSWSGLSPSD